MPYGLNAYGGGGSVGGAAAAGIQSGFQMGRELDQDAERKAQRARDNARQDELDADRRDQVARGNARQDKSDAQSDEDRALTGANLTLQDAQYQLGALHEKYGDQPIPDSEAKPLYTAVGQAAAARQALIAKRQQPIIDATTQEARDFFSRAQVGQADPNTLRGQKLRDYVKATTGHDLSEYQNGNIAAAINDAKTGIATKNPPMTIQGAGVLLGPQVRQGVGGIAPDGSQIVDKSLYALVPAPKPQGIAPPQQNPIQGLSAALSAAAAPPPPPAAPASVPPQGGMGAMGAPSPDSPAPAGAMMAPPAAPAAAPDPSAAPAAAPDQQPMDSDPTHSLAVLQVTSRQPDGSLTTYHAPVTQDRNDPNSPLAGPLNNAELMDRMGRLGVVDQWLKTPEMAGAVADALKDNTPTSFEQAWGMVHGDPKALAGAQDPTSVKIKAIKKLQADEGYETFEEAAQALAAKTAPQAKGVQATLDAIDNDDTLTDAQKAKAHQVALGLAAKPKAGKGGGGGGGGTGLSAPSPGITSQALGGASAPDPKLAYTKAVDFWAKAAIAGDKDWQAGLSRSKDGSALIKDVKLRIPGMASELGLQPQDIGTARATSAALGATLKDLTKRQSAVDLFSSKLQKDMQTYDDLLTSEGSNSPLLLNKPINMLRRQFSSPGLAQLDLAAKQVGTEYERLITGGTLSVAQLHTGAADDAKKLINGDMPPATARATMQTMLREMGNARGAAHESVAGVQNQLRALGQGPLGGVPPPSAAPPGRGAGLGAPAPAAVPTKFNEGQVYKDAAGNQARYVGGKWVPL